MCSVSTAMTRSEFHDCPNWSEYKRTNRSDRQNSAKSLEFFGNCSASNIEARLLAWLGSSFPTPFGVSAKHDSSRKNVCSQSYWLCSKHQNTLLSLWSLVRSRSPKFCKKAFGIKIKRRRNKQIMHQGNFSENQKKSECFEHVSRSRRSLEKEKKSNMLNDFRSKLVRSRQTLPRGRPEPGQWPCTQILWDRPYGSISTGNSFLAFWLKKKID